MGSQVTLRVMSSRQAAESSSNHVGTWTQQATATSLLEGNWKSEYSCEICRILHIGSHLFKSLQAKPNVFAAQTCPAEPGSQLCCGSNPVNLHPQYPWESGMDQRKKGSWLGRLGRQEFG